MNDRTIDIRNYWSKVVRDTAEFQQIANAINPELNKLLECIKRALQDSFINDATEYGVQRWESILKIEPLETDTLDDRKVRILTYLTTQVPYSTRVVKRMIASFVGEDNCDFQFCNEKDELWLGLTVTNEQVIEEIKNLLSNVLPMHIVPIYERLWYDKCKTVADMIAVNPDYQNHLDNGVWKHRLSSLVDGTEAFLENENLKRFEAKLPNLQIAKNMFRQSAIEGDVEMDLPEVTTAECMFYSTKSLKSCKGSLPKCTKVDGMFRSSYVEEITITEHNAKSLSTFIYSAQKCRKVNMDMSNVTSLSYFGEGTSLVEFKHNLQNVTNCGNAFMSNGSKKNLVEFNSALPKCRILSNGFRWQDNLTTCRYPIDVNGQSIYESGLPQDCDKYAYLTLPDLGKGDDAFNSCKLDKPTVISILNSLRQAEDGYMCDQYTKATWNIGIGIHVDHKTDEEVLQAIANAEAKGWTLTVQWTGTPTSGVSTLDLDFIYAKRTQNDEGIYIDENGTRWNVDWGHYVTDSEGYTEYNSEEEALAGLTFCGSMLPEPEMEE